MKRTKIERIMKDGKIMMLAYDQGFEHGPEDLNIKTADPNYVLDIALEGRYTAIAMQSGIADKYYTGYFKDVPLVIKLNGKTKLNQDEDILSLQHTTVKHAIELGAAGVGYTIYPGSRHEQQMFVEFGRICDQAHNAGLPVICWMRPKPKNMNQELDTNTLAYAARIAMELGADVVNIPATTDFEGLKWIVKCAGKTRVITSGGEKISDYEFLDHVQKSMEAGVRGIAVGRNIWQREDPFDATKTLKEVMFEGKTAEQALKK